MGQKVNPISLRLQQTNRFFDSCWYSEYFYVDLIKRDLQIQNYLNAVLKQVNYPSARFFIQNLPKRSKITFFFYSPTQSRKKRANVSRIRQYKKRTRRRKKSFKVISNKLFFKVVQKAYTPHGYKRTSLKRRRKLLPSGFAGRPRKMRLLKRCSVLHKNGKAASLVRHTATLNKEQLLQWKIPNLKLLIRKRKRILKHLLKFEHFVGQMYTQTAPSSSSSFLRKQFYFRYLLVLEYYRKQCSSIGWTKNHFLLLLKFKILKKKINKIFFFFKKKLKRKPFPFIKKKLKRKPLSLIDRITRIYYKYHRITKKLKEKRHKIYTRKANIPDNFPEIIGSDVAKACLSFSSLVVRLRIYQKDVDCLRSPKKIGQDSFQASIKPYFLTCKEHAGYILSKQLKAQVTLFPHKELKGFRCALFLAEEIVHYLERRIPFRRIINSINNEIKRIEKIKKKYGKSIPKKVLKDINYPNIRGIRILYSGRVGGRSKKAQRAKTECFKYGQTSLHVFSSCIDFASKNALTRFGLGGVKVWVCYRETVSFT